MPRMRRARCPLEHVLHGLRVAKPQLSRRQGPSGARARAGLRQLRQQSASRKPVLPCVRRRRCAAADCLSATERNCAFRTFAGTPPAPRALSNIRGGKAVWPRRPRARPARGCGHCGAPRAQAELLGPQAAVGETIAATPRFCTWSRRPIVPRSTTAPLRRPRSHASLGSPDSPRPPRAFDRCRGGNGC